MFPDLLDRAVQSSYLYRSFFFFPIKEKKKKKKQKEEGEKNSFGAKCVLPTMLQQVDLAFPSQRSAGAVPSKSAVFF